MVYINTSYRLLRRQRSVSQYFSGAGEVLFYIYTYQIPLRRRRSLRSIYIHHSGAGEVFLHTSPGPERYLYTVLWRRRSRRSIYNLTPILTIIHICITRCTYLTPLSGMVRSGPFSNYRHSGRQFTRYPVLIWTLG